MTDKEVKKLKREELLEILLEQARVIESLEKELADTKEKLHARDLEIARAGSIAEASLRLTDIFTKAQEAADLYLDNVKRMYETQDNVSIKDNTAKENVSKKENITLETARKEMQTNIDSSSKLRQEKVDEIQNYLKQVRAQGRKDKK